MKMKKLLILILITPILGLSQKCGYQELINAKKDNNVFINNYEYIYNEALSRLSTSTETYYIPVVFHIVYNSESQNLPDSVIHSQIEVLNEDYRRLNENASETREEFLEFAGDANIEFFFSKYRSKWKSDKWHSSPIY